jgi:hypothetical protein
VASYESPKSSVERREKREETGECGDECRTGSVGGVAIHGVSGIGIGSTED